MMAAAHRTVVDLVSSDEDGDAPPPRVRRRGLFGRASPASSTAITPEPVAPAPTFAPVVAARPAPIPRPAQEPAMMHDGANDGGAVADPGAFNIDGAQVIDLEDMMDFDQYLERPGGYPEDQPPAVARREPSPQPPGQIIVIDGEDVFIPDSPPARPVRAHAQRPESGDATYALDSATFTADVCLKRVLAMFPDIEHEHVVKLYNEYDEREPEALPGEARLQEIVEKLLSGESYPRQARPPQQHKRKRSEEITNQDSKRWEGQDREAAGPAFKGAMASILKAEFPEIPVNAISKELVAHTHLYPTYLALAKMKDTSNVNKKWGGRPAKDVTTADALATDCGWPAMSEELEAARKHVKDGRRRRVIEDAKQWAEKENLQRAIDAGETAECQACFDDLPMNRQIHCDGDTAHFTCFDCAIAYVKSEVGDSRCRVLCTAGCGASFARTQLHLLEDKALLEKLEQLQQERDIRDAGLDNLEECPFCDYKAILPPIEEDFEFRCANEQCEKVSCRRCKAISHIPRSCEEHAKDHKLSSRHKIEEAMTKALIRNCNKCKKPFIKDHGCNKMSCPSCGNLQCYVCSESLKDYNHFDQASRVPLGSKSSKCPLYDNVEERHEREIKEAGALARAEVINENPDVSEQDLEIKLSDAVKKATDERVMRGGAVPGGIPPGYGGYAGFAGGLFMPPGVGPRLRDRADGLEAAMVDLNRERVQARRRMQLQLAERLDAAAANPDGMRDVPRRQRQQMADENAAAGGDRPNALRRRMPALRPIQDPLARLIFDPMLGGFDEDRFGEGDDGDPFNMNGLINPAPLPAPAIAPAPLLKPALRIMGVPAAQGLRPGQAQANQEQIRQFQQRLEAIRNRNPAELYDYQPRQQPPVHPAPPLRQEIRQVEAQPIQARQRLDDNRGGQGRVFRREPYDPRLHHVPRGWPGQN